MTHRTEIHLCTTCPQGNAIGTALCAAEPDLATSILTFPCLGGCTRRARASITAPGKWGWMFGGLTPEAVPDLVAFIHLWRADAEGLVPKHKRPAMLRTAVLGRMPPNDAGARFVAPDEAHDPQIPVHQGGTQ